MEKRILIGSCGGLTGSYLTRQFKKKAGCTVIGADTKQENVTRHFTDEFVSLPNANDPSFYDQLIEVLKYRQIDCYIPTHSEEIKMVSKYEEKLRSNWSGNFLVCPYETILALDNKSDANRNLQKAGIPVPQLVVKITNEIRYPIFMKPDIGSGSKQSQIVETAVLHQEYSRLYPNTSFYELVCGTEYTVDCMFDENGHLLAYNQRIRINHLGGAVITTKNDYDFDILPYLKKLENKFIFKGCVNFQYILAQETPYFIDVNLRYASGGLPLTVNSGIDVPQILLDLWDKKHIFSIKSCGADRRIMYRYFEELFEDSII